MDSHAALYGSVARGEARPDSDLDIVWLTVHDDWPVLVAAAQAELDRPPDP